MDPLQMDLTWRRNAPEQAAYTLTDDVGAAVDLTGLAFELQVRLYPGAAGAALVTLGMAAAGTPGFVLDNAIAGQFSLTPPTIVQLEALYAANPPADATTGTVTFAYDVLILHPDGVLEPFWTGALILLAGVTV